MEKFFSFLIVKIKEDIKTLMLQKIINILIITASLLFTACAEDNNNDNNISHDNSSKYDFVYNEPVVMYTITGNYDTGTVEKIY